MACNFDTEKAVFSWSADGKEFAPLGEPFTMVFQLTTFQGVRFALFNYNTSGKPGGHADFDNFTVDEPRASGIERTIPVGKTITLSSRADGSLLAASARDMSLVNVPPGFARRLDARCSLPGRRSGQGARGTAGRQRPAGFRRRRRCGPQGPRRRAPGEAESFQWVNLMRGDTMLMSLTNHRYLATKPNSPGPVTASAAGPRPDRKDGACFTWREVAPSQPAPPAKEMKAADQSPEGSLRQAAKGLFDIGVGINDRIADRVADHRLLLTQFSMVTPENCMKPAKIQAAEGKWDFAQADGFVDFATKNGLEGGRPLPGLGQG